MKQYSFIDKEEIEINCYKWESKEKNIKGVVQIVHGMTEHALRYDFFARKLTEEGYIVYAHDHRGHGKTALSKELFGYIADDDGFNWMVSDVKEHLDLIKKENEGLPVFVFSHSMGSFITQRFIQKHGSEIDGVILCGTDGKPEFYKKAGIVVSKVEMALRGRKAKSKLMDKLSFGHFNSYFKPNRTNVDWLCSVDEEVDKYLNDEYCGFICTTSFYHDLIKGLFDIHKKENMESIPKELPIYIIAGDKDPVGRQGKGILDLYDRYKKLNIKDVNYKLYENGRHEILNEINKDEVIDDILIWMNGIL